MTENREDDRLTQDRISSHIEQVLTLLNDIYPQLNLEDDNLADTPRRVAKSFIELLSGYGEDPDKILAVDFPASDYDQMIVVKGIEFSSLCIHHMMPFTGIMNVGYLPEAGRVVGLSKIPRVCQAFAKRLQIQEQLTQQVCNAIMGAVKPRGVGVVIDAVHTCASMRGIKAHGASMVTSALLGEFRDDRAVKQEFFNLISSN